jgi:ferrous iron transport protein B
MPFIVSGGIAGGCAIPGVMATRTLRSPKERLATILTLPFMTCGAKLPVFLLFVGIFFQENQAMIMFLLTLTGWCTALLTARILRSTLIRGEATPFVMELPPYRMPILAGVCIHAWERIWQYIKKAGTIILAISVLIWAAMTFPGLPGDRAEHYAAEQARVSENVEQDGKARQEALDSLKNEEKREALRFSLAGRLGAALEPITRLAGFDWRANIALLAGIAAKEVVVSTLGTAYSLGEVGAEEAEGLAAQIRADGHWNIANAVALLLFTLLYSPCFPTLAVIRHETNQWRWMFFSLFFNLAVAFGVSTAAYQLLRV